MSRDWDYALTIAENAAGVGAQPYPRVQRGTLEEQALQLLAGKRFCKEHGWYAGERCPSDNGIAFTFDSLFARDVQ